MVAKTARSPNWVTGTVANTSMLLLIVTSERMCAMHGQVHDPILVLLKRPASLTGFLVITEFVFDNPREAGMV